MTKLHELHALGQSAWLDYIRRDMVEKGELRHLMEQGVRGVTSNPTLFENAIAKSDLYTDDIRHLAQAGKSVTEIYEALAFSDIRGACDVFTPLFREANGGDGFVSLEVPPSLSHNAAGTIAEAKRIWKEIDRPNLMVKVPATDEGLTAITALIAAGVNVNVTLMFTMSDYEVVAEAYIKGLERRLADGLDISGVRSVASIFVSRVDGAVDAAAKDEALDRLSGRVALANARLQYRAFERIFGSERFAVLRAKGAHVQRPLFASTGTKSDKLSDVLYIDGLIGPETVNTMPPKTLAAFLDHGTAKRTVDADYGADEAVMRTCEQAGLDISALGADLKVKGLQAFEKSFDELMQTIDKERLAAVK